MNVKTLPKDLNTKFFSAFRKHYSQLRGDLRDASAIVWMIEVSEYVGCFCVSFYVSV